MALIKQPEKEEMDYISHRLRATAVKRYRALVERGKKLHYDIPASYSANFDAWLDEAEAEVNNAANSRVRTIKGEE